jgi:hypothetical protein
MNSPPEGGSAAFCPQRVSAGVRVYSVARRIFPVGQEFPKQVDQSRLMEANAVGGRFGRSVETLAQGHSMVGTTDARAGSIAIMRASKYRNP